MKDNVTALVAALTAMGWREEITHDSPERHFAREEGDLTQWVSVKPSGFMDYGIGNLCLGFGAWENLSEWCLTHRTLYRLTYPNGQASFSYGAENDHMGVLLGRQYVKDDAEAWGGGALPYRIERMLDAERGRVLTSGIVPGGAA